ncbi:NYN domain-containing protein [Aureimonas ureilytica]|uniref:NYN domain-containing protein n=1 Tax=Aureimonas ureilytica TaxID=401562 RepID=UPI000734FEEC|nr:NYN domain-containing protein [Aureimonas ureilytica]
MIAAGSAERTAPGFVLVAFDGAHCDRIRKSLGERIHFSGLLRFLVPGDEAVRAVYHRDLRDRTEAERLDGLLRHLERKGFEVHGAAPDEMGAGPRERYGTNLVELAVAVMGLASEAHRVVLVGGDRKLVPLAQALRERGTHLTVATSLAMPEVIRASPELLAEADAVVDFTAQVLAAADDGTRND